MKILVTGGNGYLGRGIVETLISKGNEVIVNDLFLEGVSSKATKIEGDIFDSSDPYHEYGEPDILLHLAWRDGFSHNSHSHIEDLSKHVLLMEKFFSSPVKKIVVMGTMHEIGFHEGSIDEWTHTHPMNYYGIAKDSLRNFVNYMANITSKDYQWLRAYYIVGNSKRGSSIFSKIVAAEENNEKEFPFTFGKNQYDFLDYDEFCRRVAVTVCQNEINGIINVSSGEPMKLGERVDNFIKENNFNITLKYGAYPDRKYDSKATWGNSDKIEAIMKKAELLKCQKKTFELARRDGEK